MTSSATSPGLSPPSPPRPSESRTTSITPAGQTGAVFTLVTTPGGEAYFRTDTPNVMTLPMQSVPFNNNMGVNQLVTPHSTFPTGQQVVPLGQYAYAPHLYGMHLQPSQQVAREWVGMSQPTPYGLPPVGFPGFPAVFPRFG